MDRTLISVLTGLGGMFGWGTSDFLANQASEKIGHFKTFFWSQVAGLVLVALAAIFFSSQLFFNNPSLILLTIIAGIIYAVAYLLFYRGFEIGNVSVVSAVINFQILLVMAIAYFLFGQRLGPIQIPAIGLVLIGITLVSVNFKDLLRGSISLVMGVKETLIAAVLFGFFWSLNEFIVEREDWLLVAALVKLVALLTVLSFTFIRHIPLKMERSINKINLMVLAIGILEALAVMSFTFGLQKGDSIIVAPIASALTIVTVGLAIIFLKEKISLVQGAGIALTIAGIILTTF